MASRWAEILFHHDLDMGDASEEDVIRADDLADDEGTIQADDAMKLFNTPTLWTCMDLKRALLLLGCEHAETVSDE